MITKHNDSIPKYFASKIVFAYMILTPLLWASGLLIPGMIIIIIYLFIKAWDKKLWKNSIVISWWVVGVFQALSVLINFADSSKSLGFLIHRLLSTQVTGWFFLGATIGIGKNYSLDSKLIIRASVILGLYFIIFAIISVLSVQWYPSLEIPTPLSAIIPESLSAANSFYFTMHFYRAESLFIYEFPRLILFYPWPVMLGFAGISVFFITINEHRPILRFIGIFGGLIALVGSTSRVALVSFIFATLLFLFLKFHRVLLYLTATLVCILSTFAIVIRFSIFERLKYLYTLIESARLGSSSARRLVYEESWKGFLESPLIGHGWVGGLISEEIPIPIGSHSSFYGLLYTGGAVTFAVYCIAIGITLYALFDQSRAYRLKEKCAFLIAFSLSVISYAEGLYSYVLPCSFAFFFIGGTLGTCHRTLLSINSYSVGELSGNEKDKY